MKKKPPETIEEKLEAGAEAMTRSIMQLIEPMVRIRCKQFLRVIAEATSTKKLYTSPERVKETAFSLQKGGGNERLDQ